ncbi:hypothetical protein M8494_03855 [Serratia ureilytica]
MPVRIKDINETGINHAPKYSWDVSASGCAARMRLAERQKQMMLISRFLPITPALNRWIGRGGVRRSGAEAADGGEVEANRAPHTVFASRLQLLSAASPKRPSGRSR